MKVGGVAVEKRATKGRRKGNGAEKGGDGGGSSNETKARTIAVWEANARGFRREIEPTFVREY